MKKSVFGRISSAATLRALLLAFVLSGLALAQSPNADAAKQLLRQFAGSDDTDALLRHPKVRPQLQTLLGSELPHLITNLDVRGSVEVVGRDLSVSGNAPHRGTEEEAVVCISFYDLAVTAAIFSKGTITAYSRGKAYDSLPRCVTDWITQVNSGHGDRLNQPKNVRMAGSR
jgi:hypothetical protein